MRLLPPVSPAWKHLGAIRPELVRQHALPNRISVLCGIHDSSANFYRYQEAGLADFSLISTGTWIVGLGQIDRPSAFSVSEQRQCNADVYGRSVAGVLTMAGREFEVLAGDVGDTGTNVSDIAALIEAGTMALPSFADHDGLFPGSAAKGNIIGPEPTSPARRRALALLYVALLSDVCRNAIGGHATTVVDGGFVGDPLYPALVAALRPDRRTLSNIDPHGTAAGAALLAAHNSRQRPVEAVLKQPDPVHLPGLASYAARWRSAARDSTTTPS
jgi:sugar (pentulose or hexulose) kinase